MAPSPMAQNPIEPSPIEQNPAPQPQARLRAEQISLRTRRGDLALLQDIDFSLGAGERALLVGDAGSGKTLLFRLLSGLLSPTQGQIFLEGRPITEQSGPALRRRVAWVPRSPRLLGMSVKAALAYPLKLQGQPEALIHQRLTTALEMLNLPTEWLDKGESELNLGQQWQVSLARSLTLNPQVLLLEQPIPETTASTASTEDAMARVGSCLHRFQAQGGSLIIASRSPIDPPIDLGATPTQRWHLHRTRLQKLNADATWPVPSLPDSEESPQNSQEDWGDEGEEV